MPFSDILAPLAVARATRLEAALSAAGAPLSPGARRGAVEALLERLNAVAMPVLAEAFTGDTPPPAVARLFDDPPDFVPRERYAAFRAELMGADGLPCLDRWPVLRDRLAKICADWERNIAAFAAHLVQDADALRARVPAWSGDIPDVADLKGGLSDPHAGGGSVWRVDFADGTRFAYKPRSLAAECAFSRLLAELGGDETVPAQRIPCVLDAGDHGWMEWIEPAPLAEADDARSYMERCGGLLALVDLLRGGDIHPDNLVPAGAFPVIVDLECLFQPGPADLGLPDPLDDPHLFSSGILPVFTSFDGGANMVAIAAAGAGPVALRPETVVRHPGTDWLFLGNRQVPSFADGPTLEGRVLDIRDRAADVAHGYAATLRAMVRRREALLAPGGALDAFRKVPCRLLCAATNIYALVLAPALLGEGATSEAVFTAHLARAAGREPLMADASHWRHVLDAEAEALSRLDIPAFLFRPDGRDAWSVEGRQLGPVFAAPMFARVESRLWALDEAAVADRARLIAAAITPAPPVRVMPGAADAAALLRHCADQVTALAVPQGADAVVWMRLWEQIPALVAPAGLGLYYGSAGIAVFLAEAGRVLDDPRLLDLARRALHPTSARVRAGAAGAIATGCGAGYAQGLGGLIAALCWCADLLDDPGLRDDAVALARETPQALAASTGVPDLMQGAAGLALGLGLLHQSAGGAVDLSPFLMACGHAILEGSRLEANGTRHWPDGPQPGLPGLSHGTAGMAAALAHIHRITGDATYRDAALEVLAYEDTMFNAEAGTWTGEGGASHLHHQRSSWCHGAPGIALARAMVTATLGPAAAPLAPTLETALELTRATPVPAADDLCCGEAGRLEILSVLIARLGRSDLMADVDQALVSRLPDWARGEALLLAAAAPRAPGDAALFRGWAGIGHLVVRRLAPHIARDVLLPWAV